MRAVASTQMLRRKCGAACRTDHRRMDSAPRCSMCHVTGTRAVASMPLRWRRVREGRAAPLAAHDTAVIADTVLVIPRLERSAALLACDRTGEGRLRPELDQLRVRSPERLVSRAVARAAQGSEVVELIGLSVVREQVEGPLVVNGEVLRLASAGLTGIAIARTRQAPLCVPVATTVAGMSALGPRAWLANGVFGVRTAPFHLATHVTEAVLVKATRLPLQSCSARGTRDHDALEYTWARVRFLVSAVARLAAEVMSWARGDVRLDPVGRAALIAAEGGSHLHHYMKLA
jgi:hypothetical protein